MGKVKEGEMVYKIVLVGIGIQVGHEQTVIACTVVIRYR